jgi:RNA polymerase sigma factor (TIGR02999 family)
MPMSEAKRILSAIEQGDQSAAEQLLPLVYDELRRLAARRLAQEPPGQTLDPTGLVHDAYLRLVDVEQAQQWSSRGHFFAAAAEAMRRILVETARRRKADKHGGSRRRVSLDDLHHITETDDGLLALDEALARFAAEDQGARYDVDKFRKPGVRQEIEQKWENISKAIRDVVDFVRGKTFIRSDKAMPSNLVLIPLIYVRYHFPQAWQQAKDIDKFLLRSLLTGAFSGTPDQLIDDMVSKIKQSNSFDANELFDVIRSKGRSLELTEERFWQMGYGSDTIHLLFNLWYRDFNYTPAYENNLPQVDHIFLQSALKKVKAVNPRTNKRDLGKLHGCDEEVLAELNHRDTETQRRQRAENRFFFCLLGVSVSLSRLYELIPRI